MDWPVLPPSPYLDIHAPDNVRVRGTRIDICLVVEDYLEGRVPEETVLAYPTLELAQIYGVIAYYLEHRADVDRYVAARVQQARDLERAYRERPESPIVKKLKAMRAGKAA